MTPAGARELVGAGHSVVIESGAGDASGLTEDLDRAAGASVGETAEQVRDVNGAEGRLGGRAVVVGVVSLLLLLTC